MRHILTLFILVLCIQSYGYAAGKRLIVDGLREVGLYSRSLTHIAPRHLSSFSIIDNAPSITAPKYVNIPWQKLSTIRYVSTNAEDTANKDLNAATHEKSKKFPILRKIDEEINKLPSEITFDQKARHIIKFIKDNDINRKKFQKEVANNCAVQLASSGDAVFEYCSNLYKEDFMHPQIPLVARIEKGREIRATIQRYYSDSYYPHDDLSLENALLKLLAATLISY